MKSPFETQLRKKSADIIGRLSRNGIQGRIDEGSFREYMVKLSLEKEGEPLGKLSVYYSPKKRSCTVGSAEIRHRTQEVEQVLGHGGGSESGSTHGVEIYTDGSCIGNRIGYGAVVLREGKKVHELSGAVDDERYVSMRQVGGEIEAVVAAVAWCRENGITAITLFHDYTGLAQWVKGAWKAKNELTKQYADTIRGSGVAITWKKVAAHRGDRWNEYVDTLAKRGAMRSEQKEVSHEAATTLIDEAGEVAEEFSRFCAARGYDMRTEGADSNGYRVRCAVYENDERCGFIDIYNTKKKRISPHFSFPRAQSFQEIFQRWWVEFRR
jgi:ribonuclease HI